MSALLTWSAMTVGHCSAAPALRAFTALNTLLSTVTMSVTSRFRTR